MSALGYFLGKLAEHLFGKSSVLHFSLWIGIPIFGLVLLGSIVMLVGELRRRLRGRPSAGEPTSLSVVSINILLWSGLLSGFLFMWRSEANKSDQERALDAIKDAKGEVVRAEDRPDKPVLRVSFRDSAYSPRAAEVSDATLQRLQPHLEALPQLQDLDLGHTSITNSGLRYLKGLKNLKTLCVGGQFPPTNLTEDGVEDLRKSLPGVTITFERPWPVREVPFMVRP